MHGYGFNGYTMWGGGLMMLLFWGAVIVLVLWGLRTFFADGARPRGPRHVSPPDTPEEIARRRYARGEISRDEYLSIIDDLRLADDEPYHKAKRSNF